MRCVSGELYVSAAMNGFVGQLALSVTAQDQCGEQATAASLTLVVSQGNRVCLKSDREIGSFLCGSKETGPRSELTRKQGQAM